MTERTPARRPVSDGVTYLLVALIFAALLVAGLLPAHSSGTVTLTRATLTPVPSVAPPPEPTPMPTTSPVPDGTPASAPAKAPEEACTYVLNTNTRRFHDPTCASVGAMKEKNRRDFTGPREELIEQGYIPCGNCKP